MIENQKELVCSKKHNGQPIVSVLINHQIPVSQRLQCATCITELKGQYTIISFNEAKNIVLKKQEKLQEYLSESTNKTLEQLNQFKQKVDNLNQNIFFQFDHLLKNSEEWGNNLAEFKKQKIQYSFLEEIEHLDKPIKYQEEKLMYEFYQFNYSYFKKLETMFEIYGLFQDILSLKQATDDLRNQCTPQQCLIKQQLIEIKKYNDNVKNQKYLGYTIHSLKLLKSQQGNCSRDLRKDIKKEEIMKCIDCKKEGSVTVGKFQELWDKYSNDKQQNINTKQCEQQKRLEDVKRDLYSFIVDLAKIIRETIFILDNNRYVYQLAQEIYNKSFQRIFDQIFQNFL